MLFVLLFDDYRAKILMFSWGSWGQNRRLGQTRTDRGTIHVYVKMAWKQEELIPERNVPMVTVYTLAAHKDLTYLLPTRLQLSVSIQAALVPPIICLVQNFTYEGCKQEEDKKPEPAVFRPANNVPS